MSTDAHLQTLLGTGGLSRTAPLQVPLFRTEVNANAGGEPRSATSEFDPAGQAKEPRIMSSACSSSECPYPSKQATSRTLLASTSARVCASGRTRVANRASLQGYSSSSLGSSNRSNRQTAPSALPAPPTAPWTPRPPSSTSRCKQFCVCQYVPSEPECSQPFTGRSNR